MRFFIFLVLIPALVGFITPMFKMGWFDGTHGIIINILAITISNMLYWSTGD